MTFILENADKIVIILLVLIVLVYALIQKRGNIKEWLKWAVAEAEKALGSGTGQLKLREVWSMFTKQFPWVSTFISFETFSFWVDEALDWLEDQMNKNIDINDIVKGGKQ